MKNLPLKLLCLVMLISMIASPVAARDLDINSGDVSAQEIEPPVRPEPELVSEEIQELFKDGMSIEDFLVWNQGPIPNAVMEYADLPLIVIVQLDQPGLIAMKQRPDRGVGFDDAEYVDQLTAVQDGVISEVQALSSDVVIMGRYTKVINGFMAQVTAKDLVDIRSLAGVKSVTRAPEHTADLANSVPLTKSDLVWAMGDTGYTGEEITIAVIDTGIDYTHAMFGTIGDPDAYALNDPNVIEPGSFPTPKVIGGWDFAGTDYDASSNPIPVPDPDPIDEGGHGTHVASIAAGVDAGFGSGVAPDAKLYALKVFGAQGSTNLVVDAIEWAVDPNGDGYVDDHVDVINMSLGSSFGPADEADPEYMAIEAANAAGVFVVASAGNAGNQSYVTGSPGNTDSVLAVASSTSGVAPYVLYNEDQKLPYFPSYNPFTETITAELVDVVSAGNGDGELCSVEGVSDLTGKVALVKRGTCSFYIKINNAESLGAVGVLIYNNTVGSLSMDTTGSTLPAGAILKSDGELLKSLAPLTVSVGPDTLTAQMLPVPISSFSSRGPRGYDSMLKPDITAPGDSIFAAAMGTGNEGVIKGGTSMASPHVAGIAALMKQAHPTWSNEQIKAALMNTAIDLTSDGSSEVPRQGSGLVDALAAVTTDVVAVADSKFVSMNWGVIEVSEDTFSSVKTVTLRNFSDSEVTLDVGSLFTSNGTGASLTPAVDSVTIPAFNKTTVDFTLNLDMTLMPIDFFQMEEYYGYLTFTGDDANLRVPFYFVPRPYTEITEIDNNTDIEYDEMGWVDVEQSGPVASSLWGFPVTMVSDNDPGVIDMGDLRYVGMDTDGTFIYPGFAMWDDQHTLQPYWSEVDLWIYGDMPAPVVNFNYNYGAATGGYPNNDWIVLQIDYNDGMVYLGSPYNIYADYNSGFMEWYLPASWQWVTGEFDYEVASYDWYATEDYAGMASFDITKSPMVWGLTEFYPFGSTSSLLFMLDNSDGYILSQPQGMMLVDYNGKPGDGQAYFWPVTVEGSSPKINEFSFSTTGTDVEYLELFGLPNTDYSRYSILEIESDPGSYAGEIDGYSTPGVYPMGTTDENGLYLAELNPNDIENSSITLLLVKDFSGEDGMDLDEDNDGVLDVFPWVEIVDSVAVSDGDGYAYGGAPQLYQYYDELYYSPGGASRIPDGLDTDTVFDWVRNDFDLFGIQGEEGSPDWHEAVNTPGEPNELCIDTTAARLYITGATADGDEMEGSVWDGFELVTTGDPDVDHLIDFAEGSDTDEPLADEYFGLYLSDSTVSAEDLKAYYDDRGVPSPFLEYLKAAVDGTNPFVYIKGDPEFDFGLSLVDAAKHDLVPEDVPMTVPDDYPEGTYTVSGFVVDTAGNETEVTLILIVKDPPELMITGATADGEPMAGDLVTGYILETTNIPTLDHEIQFAAGSVSSELLADEFFGLYLADSTVTADDLKAYYDDRGVPEPFLEYLKKAVDGENPFVYIKGEPADPYGISLVDAAKHDLVPEDGPMTVPDDFPLGTYTVTGMVKDEAGFETEVTLILIVSGDRESPELTITGAEADGEPMQGDLENGYELVTDGDPSVDHLIQFAEGTESNEPLAEEYFGLYLIDSTVSSEDLKDYYVSHGTPSEPIDFLGYLQDAADGLNPFVYIKGTTVTLVDAAKWDLLSEEHDMTVPDDFPVGTYTVSGEIFDPAGNETTVILKLIVTRTAEEVYSIYLPLIMK